MGRPRRCPEPARPTPSPGRQRTAELPVRAYDLWSGAANPGSSKALDPVRSLRRDARDHTGLMAVFVRKLFGIGKLPADLRTQVEAEGLLYLAEYVAVTRRFSGVIPGMRASHSVGSYVGSLAFTSQRVLGTLSVVPKLAGRAIDVRWDQAQAGAGDGRDLVDGPATRTRRRRCRPEVQRPTVAALQRRHPRRGADPVAAPLAGLRCAAGIRLPRGRRHL